MSRYQFLESATLKSGVTVKNRVVLPPMTECMALANGEVSRDELRYAAIHAGGVGMFITPVAYVNARGKGFEGQLSVDNDRFIPGLNKLATAIQQKGTKAILQIFSAGRMSSSAILRGQKTVSASAVAAPRPGMETPEELTNAEIEQTITDFGEATRRAIQAGFDGVEIHGANTYLIQQFFSPHSNRRTDKWGGSVEKRMTFPLRVVDAVQTAVKTYADRPFVVGYRFSPEEIEEPGIRMADTLQLVAKLDTLGLDYLHVSMGNVWRPSINDKSDKTPLIDQLQDTVKDTPLISVGNVKTPVDAERVMDAGIDFVAIGRESIREPHWVEKVEAGAEDSIRYTLPLADLDELGIASPYFDFLAGMDAGGAHIGFEPALATTEKGNAEDLVFRK
ncbi:NADH-dependent flavin oxidoreductase [Levilactobacillus yiduensis]|uniref:NADH-dependent flavin oxidoreductase n=1 Tax=Levilactobacillus yiduensis TaxID=2953880 RepID=UPI000EF333E5|nr:NADH-dependent flavin oxidoreductase [Levilactobacillus yiduensis]AYM01995.1 NADH-dependent flavin oxidoreductase [Levilactobacillus brevis]